MVYFYFKLTVCHYPKGGLLPRNFIQRTELSACKNVSAKHETSLLGSCCYEQPNFHLMVAVVVCHRNSKSGFG